MASTRMPERSVQVDALMAKPLSLLWQLGFDTALSCQGGRALSGDRHTSSPAFITFATMCQAAAFVRLVRGSGRRSGWRVTRMRRLPPLVTAYFPHNELSAVTSRIEAVVCHRASLGLELVPLHPEPVILQGHSPYRLERSGQLAMAFDVVGILEVHNASVGGRYG